MMACAADKLVYQIQIRNSCRRDWQVRAEQAQDCFASSFMQEEAKGSIFFSATTKEVNNFERPYLLIQTSDQSQIWLIGITIACSTMFM